MSRRFLETIKSQSGGCGIAIAILLLFLGCQGNASRAPKEAIQAGKLESKATPTCPVPAQKRKALDLWNKRISTLKSAASGESKDSSAFLESCRFFEELTGILVPADHAPLLDWYPTSETSSVIPDLEDWYRKHQNDLYWDEEWKEVRLCQGR